MSNQDITPTITLTGSGAGFPDVPVTYLPSLPISVFPQFGMEHAVKLASLPRSRSDEPTSVPAACAITALVPAIIGIIDSVHLTPLRFEMGISEFAEVAIFLGCLVWYVVERRRTKAEQTSLEYLEQLRTGNITAKPPTIVPKRAWYNLWHG